MEILITGEKFRVPIMNPCCPIKTQEIELLNYPSTVRETLLELLHHENTKHFEAFIVIPQVMRNEFTELKAFSYKTKRNDGSVCWYLCTEKIIKPINLLSCIPKKITGSMFIEQYTDETRTKVRKDSPYKDGPISFNIYLDGSSLISNDKPNPNIPVIDTKKHLKP